AERGAGAAGPTRQGPAPGRPAAMATRVAALPAAPAAGGAAGVVRWRTPAGGRLRAACPTAHRPAASARTRPPIANWDGPRTARGRGRTPATSTVPARRA